ncbi:MAG: hypothetical protein ACQ9MH_26975 [Nitrospinales bacterium]
MWKYIGGLIIVVICAFVLEYLEIIDIPYVALPDLTIAKQEMVKKTDTVYYKIN